MATHRNPQQKNELPSGLQDKGLAAWRLLSKEQQQIANEYSFFDTAYYDRFCKLLNDPKLNLSIIQQEGVLNGLTPDGKKVWDGLDVDVQLEVFLTNIYGSTPHVLKFINNVWTPFKEGSLTFDQIEHGIQTLANEVEETVTVFLNSVEGEEKPSHIDRNSKAK